jgi:hypothetical protein
MRKFTLTPALSHRMGEGGTARRSKRYGVRQWKQLGFVPPSPIRWERAGVRVQQIRLLQLAAVSIIALLFFSLTSHAAASAQFVLVSKGEPKAEIVVQENQAPEPLAFAAQELQRYVKKISGAELPIVHARSRKLGIVLTVRPLQQDKKALEDPREEDRYRLNVDSKNLQIEGTSPRAVLYGVYDLLERLGCGWCVPGDDTIPKADTLKISSLQVDTRPAFQYRMMLDYPLLSVAQSIAIADWIAKNRLNWDHPCPNAFGEPKAWYERRELVAPELKKRGLRLIIGGHTIHTWVPTNNFAVHPEWFAYIAGQRQQPALCLANTDMTAELIKNMQRFLDRCPEVDVVDLWHSDDAMSCHCSKCTRGLVPESANGKKPDSVPGDAVTSAYVITYVEFVNRVADVIAKSHPKVMIGPLIYGQTDRAMPDGCPAFADNVLIGLAHIDRDSYRPLSGEPKSARNVRFLGNDLTWIAKSKHHFIYEYYNCWIEPFIYPGSQVIVRDLQTFRALDVQGSSSDMYGYSPINMYVAARALWSPDISWKDTIRDFCMRYYGDVGEEMAKNEIRLETGIFGLRGYQAGGALDPDKPGSEAFGGYYLKQQRPKQIEFLNGLIERTKDPQVKVRLERQLKPWTMWSKQARWWAFPEFKERSP